MQSCAQAECFVHLNVLLSWQVVLVGYCLAWQEWVDILEKDANIWDQNAFNDLFRRGSRPLEREDRLFE